MGTAYDFELTGLKGAPIRLADHAGRPMLISNTASLCGFTPHYAGLQRLYSMYADRGLMVLAVPSNDFGGQEPGGPESIAECAVGRFGATFPMAARAHVRGPDALPLFRWLGQEAGLLGRPRWNFYKYVIGRDGRLAAWFGSLTRPDSHRVRVAIERCLGTE